MMTTIFAISFAMLQGAPPPSQSSDRTSVDHRLPVVISSAPMCPSDFCDDFFDVCLDSGASVVGCALADEVCANDPCWACDDAVTDCNMHGGKHCDDIGYKCREQLNGCCELDAQVECASADNLGDYTEQFCVDHPWGRPATCGTSPPSAASCEKVMAIVQGCDITLCEYKACTAALLVAPCNVIPPECDSIASC